MYYAFPAEFETAFRSGDQHRAVLFHGGDRGGRERWKHRQVGVRCITAAPLGILRPQQFGTGN